MPRTDRSRPALALSGGGFRATLFHCGALIRLNELGWLPRLERIASVSGGSIVAGRLAARWHDLVFDRAGRAENLDALVIEPLRSFCRRNVDVLTVGLGSLIPGKSIGDVLADTYDEHLMDGVRLEDMPDVPQFIFKSTNLQTGRMVRFSKRRLADYRIGEIPHPKNIPIAVAVAASSAFPPVLSPVVVKTSPGDWVKLEGADLHGNAAYTRRLVLTDGGAYDNIGLESIDTFQTMLVSDAGAPFAFQLDKESMWHKQVMRALDIATDQARGLRKRLMFAEAKADGRKAVYWGIDQDGTRNLPPQALPAPRKVTVELARMRTRLDRFKAREQGQLINWGYAACDNAMRLYADTAASPPPGWPVPSQALG